MEATADRLVRSYGLRHKSVLEIGCGAAEFLSLLCAKGGNHGVGYDPSQQSRVARVGDGTIMVVAESFKPGEQTSFDLVCSQHVLEHLAHGDDVEALRRHLRMRKCSQ